MSFRGRFPRCRPSVSPLLFPILRDTLIQRDTVDPQGPSSFCDVAFAVIEDVLDVVALDLGEGEVGGGGYFVYIANT